MAADVDDTLPEWSTTESSNKPLGGTAISTNLDDNLRMLSKVVRGWLAHKGSDIASAGTTDLGAVEGLMHDITGTTTITSFGTVSAGIWKIIKFEGALTLTHNATSLILPGAANITTADGDIAVVISEGSGNWRCVSYIPAATAPIAASQTEQEAGTTNTRFVTPGRQHYHASAAKAWVYVDTAAGIQASYGVTSVTDVGTGLMTVNFSTNFSSTSYCAVCNIRADAALIAHQHNSGAMTAAACAFRCINTSNSGVDPNYWFAAFYGDQ